MDLEYLADVAPFVFENIVRNLDGKSIYAMLLTNRLLGRFVHSMLNANLLEKRLLPYRDTTVTISDTTWDLGFNTFEFSGFNVDLAENPKIDPEVVRIQRQPFGSKGLTEIKMSHLAQYFKGFQPKKIVFDMNNDYLTTDQHLNFLKTIDVVPGTTTEVRETSAHHIPVMCAVTKPKKLIFMGGNLNQENEEDYFEHESFKTVTHLTMGNLRYFDHAAKTFNLEPISEQLIFFEFTSCIPYFPNSQANILLEKWANGEGQLQTMRITVKFDNSPLAMRIVARNYQGIVGPNQLLINNFLLGPDDKNPGWNHIESSEVLEGIDNTPIGEFEQLPELMQKNIVEDLVGLDRNAADMSYYILSSPSKNQTGCLYYSRSIEPTQHDDQPRGEAVAYLGFRAFDCPAAMEE